jgi:hypothetical protein
MSPLLRALTYRRTAHGPVTDAMLLQAYAALDAFRRGHGSRELFGALARYLLIAEELARLDHYADALADIQRAHAAMVALDAGEPTGDGAWRADDAQYEPLCTALAILDAQLADASLSDIAMAETRMVEGLLKADSASARVAEAAMR